MKDKLSRFKFRFWHKPTEKMIDCYGYNKDFVFGDVLDGIGTEYSPAKFEDCILMQCTGVQDTQGTYIYEGDIVEINDYNALGYPRQRIGEVKFGYGDHYPAFYVITTFGDAKDFNANMKVIGNIYEDKKLLVIDCEEDDEHND